MKISKDLINNDVPANGQIQGDECVSFSIAADADIKVLFLGNSITRHGPAENIGWLGDWGMAASCKENDYVHKFVGLLERGGKNVSFCVANLSGWERSRDMSLLESRYAVALEFNADTANGTRIILTDLFWEYEPFDVFVQKFAEEKSYGFAQIHDLGNYNGMKALEQFAHKGVAVHPNDKGMEEIAKRIYGAIKRF